MSKTPNPSATSSAITETAEGVQAGAEALMNAAPGIIRGAMKDAETMAHNGIERARQASAKVREQVGIAGEKTVTYIQDEPVKSVLLAAAVGAVSAVLIAWLARSRAER